MTPPKLLYKYVTSSTAEKILSNSSFRFSNPRTFNDPYDMDFNYLLQDPSQILSSGSDEEIERFLTSGQNTNNDKLDALLSYLQLAVEQNVTLEFVRNDPIVRRLPSINTAFLRRQISKGLAICSFTSEPNNLLMWSHYSQDHTGVVIGISPDFPTHKYSGNFPTVGPVNYSKSIPSLSYRDLLELQKNNPDSISKVATDFLLLKSTDWEYEKEWRYITWNEKQEDNDYMTVAFSPDKIQEIYIGVRMEQDAKDQIIALTKTQSSLTKIYCMKKHPQQFRIVPDQCST